jgi:hypothetical protein
LLFWCQHRCGRNSAQFTAESRTVGALLPRNLCRPLYTRGFVTWHLRLDGRPGGPDGEGTMSQRASSLRPVAQRAQKGVPARMQPLHHVELIQDFCSSLRLRHRMKYSPMAVHIFCTVHAPRVRVYELANLSLKFERHFDGGRLQVRLFKACTAALMTMSLALIPPEPASALALSHGRVALAAAPAARPALHCICLKNECGEPPHSRQYPAVLKTHSIPGQLCHGES